jgi:hypothetical protein
VQVVALLGMFMLTLLHLMCLICYYFSTVTEKLDSFLFECHQCTDNFDFPEGDRFQGQMCRQDWPDERPACEGQGHRAIDDVWRAFFQDGQ